MRLEAAARCADVRLRLQGRIQLYSAGAGGASVASVTPVFKFVKPEELVKCASRALRLSCVAARTRRVTAALRARFKGLSHDEMLVFQLIQQSGNLGAASPAAQ